jgi:beta-glucanase (GH16 family)
VKRSQFVMFLAILAMATSLAVFAPGSAPPAEAVVQRGATTLTPQILQPGTTVARADAAKLSGTISFRPVRKGRPVVIQRRVPGGTWYAVATRRQNGQGSVGFTGPARSSGGAWFDYRGMAKRWNGLKKFAAAPQSASVWGTSPRFSDEFSGTALSNAWTIRNERVYAPASDRACSASYADAVTVGGGRLSLSVKAHPARRERVGPCDASFGNRHANRHWYKNGHIGTAGRFQFRYGVAAARIKFDRNTGAHGAFWMQSTVPDRDGYGPAYDGAEIDTAEYFGKNFQQGDIYTFIHYRDAADRNHKVPRGPVTAARKALGKDDDWFKKYHVFSVAWSPHGYTFRVDGVRTLRLTQGVSRVPEFLILSMLSSGWEIGTLNRDTLPNATQVDWVRVWQK